MPDTRDTPDARTTLDAQVAEILRRLPTAALSDLAPLVEARTVHLETREAEAEAVTQINAGLVEVLQAHNLQRHQLDNGTVVQIVSPRPRQVILAERLLELGVSPTIIQQATKETPVKPSIRVDAIGASAHYDPAYVAPKKGDKPAEDTVQ